MGKASSKKKRRREHGYNKESLTRLRSLVDLADQTGGMVKLTMGIDGQGRDHWVVYTATAEPEVLCGELVVGLEPSEPGVEKPTCPVCLEIPPAVFQQVQIELGMENRKMLGRARQLLSEMGA